MVSVAAASLAVSRFGSGGSCNSGFMVAIFVEHQVRMHWVWQGLVALGSVALVALVDLAESGC